MIFLIVPAVTILLYLFLICPSLRRHPDREFFNGRMIAHRGLHELKNGIPENSLLAFDNAICHGYAAETDIQLTHDGRIAVVHDSNLKRLCGVDRQVNELTLKELKALPLCGTDEHIPTLEELLVRVDGRIPLLIEFKCDQYSYRSLCEKADAVLKNYRGSYLIQSFCPPAVGWYRKHRPDICRGQLADGMRSGEGYRFFRFFSAFLLLNCMTRPDFISYNKTYSGNPSRRLCALLGAPQAGWTFRSKKELTAFRKIFNAFIFENFTP